MRCWHDDSHVGDHPYADFCSREVWGLRRSGGNATPSFVGLVPANPSSFGEDLAGELYLTAFDGKVHRLAPAD